MRVTAAGSSSTARPLRATATTSSSDKVEPVRRTVNGRASARALDGANLVVLVVGGQLVGVRDRHAAQAAFAGLVVAHAPERGRVDMDRRRGRSARVTHAVNRRAVEVEDLTRFARARPDVDPSLPVAVEEVLRQRALA